MHIGLIGGIGPAATDFYYRRLITAYAQRQEPLELTLVHADTPTLLGNLASNNVAAQVAIYSRLAARLEAAGAESVVVTSIAGHFCIEAFKAVCALPVIDMIAEVRQAIAQRGLKRVGILGTRTVMESRFYGGITSAEIILPSNADLAAVHQAYSAMATAGSVTDAQRGVFRSVGERLLNEGGAEALMLGGTDLALVFNAQTGDFPLVDCAGIHVDSIVRLALG